MQDQNQSTPALWRQILRRNFTQWEPLADFLMLNPVQRKQILSRPHFPLNLPMRLAEKVTKGSLDDPILRQFLPTIEETKQSLGFVNDPVGDQCARKTEKLLHKYHGRVLLVCTSACAMHCRYCFRQKFDYAVTKNSFSEELTAISSDSSIQEVLLSGGDPLSLSDQVLHDLLMGLAAIPHLKRIRFHTRFPIGIPERIDDNFLNIFRDIPQQIVFVTHANHPRELDEVVLSHLKRLRMIGMTLLNQAVLLRGVNDNVSTLKQLCETLVNNGIGPYYLHQLDRVQGAAHFEVTEQEGIALIQELSKLLPGYALPRYVREIAGEPAKTVLA